MMAVRTSIRAEHLPDSLANIRSAIEKAVPHGRTTVGRHYDPSKDRGLWYNTPEINQIRFKALEGGLRAILEKQNDKLLTVRRPEPKSSLALSVRAITSSKSAWTKITMCG